MASPPGPQVIFQAPGSATSDRTYYDPYRDFDTTPGPHDYQNVPLISNRSNAERESKDFFPRVLQSLSSRSGRRPSFLTLPTLSSTRTSASYKLRDFDTSKADQDDKQPYTGLSVDDSFLNTPSASLLPGGHPRIQRRHPFYSGFEPPPWLSLVTHGLLCVIAYPVFLFFVFITQDRTLFWVRTIVGAGCGLVGYVLGASLIHLGKNILEAAVWATIIHQSKGHDAPGVELNDIVETARESVGPFPTLRLLVNRLFKYTNTARRRRGAYDKRPWSFALVLFLLLAVLAACLPFIMGRLVDIDTVVTRQRLKYTEISVKGDLSQDDLERAANLATTFNTFELTWTLSPFSSHGALPPAVKFKWQDEDVYFAEVSQTQLLPDGSGFGTFQQNTTDPSVTTEDLSWMTRSPNSGRDDELGSLLRFPRWGIRMHCEKIKDPQTNIVPKSPNGFTYLYTSQDQLRSLFSSFSMDFPDFLTRPLNTSTFLQLNDTVSEDLDQDNTPLGAAFYDNGVGHSFKSSPITMGAEGFGWQTLEWVIVRLNTTWTPQGKFPIFGATDPDGTRIGYDAAICLELFEPYIVEAYNTTGTLPSSTRIVSKGKTITDASVGDEHEKRIGKRLGRGNVKIELNSTGYSGTYDALHGNSVNQMLKDNGRDSSYVPSPTVVSFTSGSGPDGYTELSEQFFAQARCLADASNMLPYFAGSGDTLARRYSDLSLAGASVRRWQMLTLLGIVLAMGLVSGLCIPKLPLGVRKRGFDVYSWVAAFQGDELIMDKAHLGIDRKMELEEIKRRTGKIRFRIAF